MGELIMKIKGKLKENGTNKFGESGIMVGRVRQGGNRWSIVGVQVEETTERVLQGLKRWGEEKREREYVLIKGRDFKARAGKEREVIERKEKRTNMEEEKKRRMKR